MRRIAAAIAGGIFVVIAVMGSCHLPRDYPDFVPDAGVDLIDGTKVDGMQACLDWCTLSKQLCSGSLPDTDCAAYCEVQFGNATAACKNELSAMYACYLQGAESPGDGGDPCVLSCRVYQMAAVACISENGCVLPNGCNPIGPNDAGCYCHQECRGLTYISLCEPTGTMTSVCECRISEFVDEVLIGTCEGGPEPFCDLSVWKGCCNEYFKL